MDIGETARCAKMFEEDPLNFCARVQTKQTRVAGVGVGPVAQEHIDQIVGRVHPHQRPREPGVPKTLPRRQVAGGARIGFEGGFVKDQSTTVVALGKAALCPSRSAPLQAPIPPRAGCRPATTFRPIQPSRTHWKRAPRGSPPRLAWRPRDREPCRAPLPGERPRPSRKGRCSSRAIPRSKGL